MLARRGPPELTLAEFAASVVMSRAALGAAPIKIPGIHRMPSGCAIYGQPVVARLHDAASELNEAGDLLARLVRVVSHDARSNIQPRARFATRVATRDEAVAMHGSIASGPARRSVPCC